MKTPGNLPPYFQYWGKARSDSNSSEQYHLLPYHCMDVAAVGRAYLTRHTHLLNFFAVTMSVRPETALAWISYWLALHDLGKYSEAFQNQRPDLLKLLLERERGFPYTERHDSLGQWLWDKALFSQLLVDEDLFDTYGKAKLWREGLAACLAAVTGHHGQPPKPYAELASHYKRADEDAAATFARDAAALLLPSDARDDFFAQNHTQFNQLAKGLSWWLAGVAVLADWLGSNTKYFPYESNRVPLRDYWERIQPQAEYAVRDTGVLPQPIARGQTLGKLFTGIEHATPLQAWADTCALADGPQLYLLEDVTGAGKTEAAITLAYRLMAAGHASGLFIGLPTMATADAMYGRIAKVCEHLFDDDAHPSLVLAHSQRRLSAKFTASVLQTGALEGDARQQDATATARCNAWLADSNKKALLASVGVGTIDQALQGVLHARHQSLRLLGLYHKVLLVDEVHACDAYMLRLLEGLLRFHAAAGGSAILLSATLPQAMKQKLVSAYAEGRAWAKPVLCSESYPLATRIAEDGAVMEQALATRISVRRRVAVDYVDSEVTVVARIGAAIKQGRCVCWIRNTVADAMVAYQRLAAQTPLLFHARFAMGDRLDKEAEVLRRFGPDSGTDQRRGRLVIATQVVEQSLDVDFDLVISDLAPIDRLIQRAGRLRRHPRDASGKRVGDGPDQRGEPLLVIHGPEWSDAPGADWIKSAFPKAAFVYPHHGQLWLAARLLREGGGFSMPEDARGLIEGVYGDDAQMSIPKGLQASADRAEGDAVAHTSIAHENGLKLERGYVVGDYTDWWRDAVTPTRLGEATSTVRLARWVDGKLLPWCEGEHGWDLSQVRVNEKCIKATAVPADPTRRVELERVLAMLPDEGKWSVLLPLEQTGEGLWRGVAQDIKAQPREWLYCADLGLRLQVNNKETIGGNHEPD